MWGRAQQTHKAFLQSAAQNIILLPWQPSGSEVNCHLEHCFHQIQSPLSTLGLHSSKINRNWDWRKERWGGWGDEGTGGGGILACQDNDSLDWEVWLPCLLWTYIVFKTVLPPPPPPTIKSFYMLLPTGQYILWELCQVLRSPWEYGMKGHISQDSFIYYADEDEDDNWWCYGGPFETFDRAADYAYYLI